MTTKIKIISSENLSYNDIPDENAKWHEISMFAHTFDIFEYNPYSIFKEDYNDIDENSSISYLRARLYAEQRRWNHYGRPIDDDTRLGVKKILNILKEKYKQKHI